MVFQHVLQQDPSEISSWKEQRDRLKLWEDSIKDFPLLDDIMLDGTAGSSSPSIHVDDLLYREVPVESVRTSIYIASSSIATNLLRCEYLKV